MIAGGKIPLIMKATAKCQKLNWIPQKTAITEIIPIRKIKKMDAQENNSLVVNFIMIQLK